MLSNDHPPEASHDYKLLPPEGVVTPSPDNPPTIDYSDIPKESSCVGETSPPRSPPNLSPETFENEDQESCPSNSPSQSPDKHRSRRKPTLEDIVRRMRNVEDGTDSEEDMEEEDSFNQSLSIDMQHKDMEIMNGKMEIVNGKMEKEVESEGQDEVDGEMVSRRLAMMEEERLNKLKNESLQDQTVFELNDKKSLLNGDAIKDGDESKEVINGHSDEMEFERKLLERKIKEEGFDENTADKLAEISALADKITKSADFPGKPPANGNWFHGAFGSLPIFPFSQGPMEHPLNSSFLPFLDGKFASPQEVEKDYLKCQFCERTFRRQKNLENHIENTHHGKGTPRRKTENSSDMYFKCTHCPYTTKHQSNLYVHLRIHTGMNRSK